MKASSPASVAGPSGVSNSGISLAGIAVGINKFLKGITDAVSDVTKLTDQIKGILDSVRGCLLYTSRCV